MRPLVSRRLSVDYPRGLGRGVMSYEDRDENPLPPGPIYQLLDLRFAALEGPPLACHRLQVEPLEVPEAVEDQP